MRSTVSAARKKASRAEPPSAGGGAAGGGGDADSFGRGAAGAELIAPLRRRPPGGAKATPTERSRRSVARSSSMPPSRDARAKACASASSARSPAPRLKTMDPTPWRAISRVRKWAAASPAPRTSSGRPSMNNMPSASSRRSSACRASAWAKVVAASAACAR